MFDQGGELKDIVSALRITPERGPPPLQGVAVARSTTRRPRPSVSGPGLLDEDPRAEEAFLRAMAQAAGLAFPPTRKPKK